MNLIKMAAGFVAVVAWCAGTVKKTGADWPVHEGGMTIDSIVLSIRQGNDGKESATGFRMDIDPGMAPGASADPMFTVYTCGTENKPFHGYSTATIVLKPAPGYKGKLDLATLQRSGGHIHIWPICYLPDSASDKPDDVWDITNVVMRIGGWGGSLVWNMDGANMLVLSSKSGNEADLYFDAGLKAQEVGK
jgi:hypothetical protein